ncbi:hypothetical protein H2204_002498 [Knufia peltigerae]|uniref:Heterokaryon incompatibility domain-containing protein n=1 Tax=Knufia peltigerae TaxID=1002370 RepID=A0AA38YAV3_9EURO|nr:hypothetical protein H2204_002498 [Knufia peltigerae]
MRLIRISDRGKLSLTDDLDADIPPYAILSHRWGPDQEEVTLKDLEDGIASNKEGYIKIQFCADQVRKDDLHHFWIDTCCIDKTNLVELSEAIVSMFRWYANAERCYVFLSDVSVCKRDNTGSTGIWESAFRRSKWFKRGWTLQELLAPRRVDFYSRESVWLGDKDTLERVIHEVTRIPVEALRGCSLEDFSPEERMRWLAGRETRKTEDMAYCLFGIFDVSMPIVYGEGNRAFDRLKDAIAGDYRRQLEGIGQSLVHSHSSSLIVRGSGRSSTPTEEARLVDHRKAMLASLGFEQMDSRRSTIKTAYSSTCQWLLKHCAYLDWIDPEQLSQHCGFLWINGKPGAGKSTLVKFALANADKARSESEIILSFFFNARGDELERSTIGMYRALLFQLLTKMTDLQDLLDDVNNISGQGGSPAWTVETLCRLLSAATARLGHRRIKCFIDALDECDEEQVQEMVFFFEELSQTALEREAQLYVCFASRHYPTIDIRNGRQLTLENEVGHAHDLAKYVQRHLRAGARRDLEEVRVQIQEKANGVFMWAVLVIPILNDEYKSGRIPAVKKRLQEIPDKLSDLFRTILRRDCANMNDLLLCLRWILFAKRPLRREEFYFAMWAGLDPDSDAMAVWDSEHITVDDMNRFVLSSSKGLAELTKSKTPTVQFIHESVRDFLLKDNGLCELWPDLENNLYSTSHDQLKDCCRTYLHVDVSGLIPSDQHLPKASSESAKNLRQALTNKLPFLDYASRYVLCHADEAATGVSQDDFLRDFALGSWVKIHNLLAPYDTRRYTSYVTLLYILAEKNLAMLVRTACKNGAETDFRGERYQFPLFAALANGHRDVVRALLQQNGKAPTEDITADLEFSRAFSARKDHTPLSWALDKGHRALAEALMTFPVNSFNVKYVEGRTQLSLAAIQGYGRIVNSLLTMKGIDVNTTDKFHRTPLSYAVERGHQEIVQNLLDSNAELELKDSAGKTALHWAASSESDTIVQHLLDKHANIEAIDSEGMTALMWAAQSGRESIVQLLLDKNADIEAIDSDGMTALMRAAENGRESIVQCLLDMHANIEATDQIGKTVLIWAAQNGRESIVRLLLDENADIEVTDNDGMTALVWAAQNGRESIVRLLLDKDANIEATDKTGKTALLWAVTRRQYTIIDLVTARGANIDVRDEHGRTPLSHAAENGDKHSVQLLLARHANVTAEDENGRTPLLWAVGDDVATHFSATTQSSLATSTVASRVLLDYQLQLMLFEQQNKKRLTMARRVQDDLLQAETIELLLAKDSKVDARGVSGKTALILAAQKGLIAVVRQLLRNNADVEARDKFGKTALLWAAENGQTEIVQHLLDMGANTEVEDHEGQTVIALAGKNQHVGIIELLQQPTTN